MCFMEILEMSNAVAGLMLILFGCLHLKRYLKRSFQK